MKEVAFLFGAGVSKAVKMPSTDELTELILEGKNVEYENSHFTVHENQQAIHAKNTELYLPLILCLLKNIKEEFELNKNYLKKVNYEDLFFAISQIWDDITGNFVNPCVRPFFNKVECKCKITDNLRKISRGELPSALLHMAQIYIKDLITQKLEIIENDKLNNLDVLKNIFYDDQISHINIFTLNHDLVLEKYFANLGIDYNDGFNNEIDNVCFWNIENFSRIENKKINIIKLHGSINWYLLKNGQNNSDDEPVKIIKKSLIAKNEEMAGPIFLVGTYNKMAEYYVEQYFLLSYLFYKKLSKINTIIISGYSFGDKGINQRIIEWMQNNKRRKIIIIAPNIEEEIRNSYRNAITNMLQYWKNNDRIILINKGIENINWWELSKLF